MKLCDGIDGRNEEGTLIRRAREGDPVAFADLCERYRRRVWRVVASVTRGGADTDDLAQEAILRAFRSLASFRGESSFEAWLCRIALNAAHDHQKSAWRRRVLFWGHAGATDDDPAAASIAALAERSSRESGATTAADPHDETERRDVQRRIREAVASLGTKERVPIWLIYFEEFSLAEVARLEGIPESTVRSRVKVGLKRLEKNLGDLRLPGDEADKGEGFSAGPRKAGHLPPQATAFGGGSASTTQAAWIGKV